MNPEDLKQPEQFPDDLKMLLAQLKLPTTDPVLPLLAWIWKQMADAKMEIDSGRLAITAMLDERLRKMTVTVEQIAQVNLILKHLEEALQEKPLSMQEQVEEHISLPLAQALTSCDQIQKLVLSLLDRVEQTLNKKQKQLQLAWFLAGACGGGLIIACLSHL